MHEALAAIEAEAEAAIEADAAAVPRVVSVGDDGSDERGLL